MKKMTPIKVTLLCCVTTLTATMLGVYLPKALLHENTIEATKETTAGPSVDESEPPPPAPETIIEPIEIPSLEKDRSIPDIPSPAVALNNPTPTSNETPSTEVQSKDPQKDAAHSYNFQPMNNIDDVMDYLGDLQITAIGPKGITISDGKTEGRMIPWGDYLTSERKIRLKRATQDKKGVLFFTYDKTVRLNTKF